MLGKLVRRWLVEDLHDREIVVDIAGVIGDAQDLAVEPGFGYWPRIRVRGAGIRG